MDAFADENSLKTPGLIPRQHRSLGAIIDIVRSYDRVGMIIGNSCMWDNTLALRTRVVTHPGTSGNER